MLTTRRHCKSLYAQILQMSTVPAVLISLPVHHLWSVCRGFSLLQNKTGLKSN